MPILLNNVAVSLGGKEILSNVNATISAGLTAIRGPSGAGKSTLLAAIAGQVDLRRGSVVNSDAGPIGWIFQSAPVLAHRSALDNVALGPLSLGASRGAAVAAGRRALAELGIERHEGQPVFRLSGGERQRVAIARELSRGLGTILADEPTASLDSATRETVCNALVALGSSGATVVIATHDEYVSARCDVTYVLDDGRLQKT